MAAKKARKRAYIPPSHEVENRRERTTSSRTTAPRPRSRGNARAQYEYPQPGLKRTAKRLPIYFVLIFALQFWMIGQESGDISTRSQITGAAMLALVITVVFAPFMHLMDRFAYNRYLKRSGGSAQKPASKDS